MENTVNDIGTFRMLTLLEFIMSSHLWINDKYYTYRNMAIYLDLT